jgi:LuxR family transcriptional regulator, quorum-sensing system regulator BjaR1
MFAGWVPNLDIPIENSQINSRIVVQKMPSEWTHRYVERGYAFRDPVVHRLQTERSPFTWAEAYASSPIREDVKLIEGEASEFGLRQGFVVPIALLDGYSLAFSFGGETLDLDADQLAVFAFATNFIVGHMLNLASTRETPEKLTVSVRERECLMWAAEGKTDWEIAQILAISRNTVLKHLQSVRWKLDALNKFHAIAKAFRMGLLR